MLWSRGSSDSVLGSDVRGSGLNVLRLSPWALGVLSLGVEERGRVNSQSGIYGSLYGVCLGRSLIFADLVGAAE